jgi:hypothetical protein
MAFQSVVQAYNKYMESVQNLREHGGEENERKVWDSIKAYRGALENFNSEIKNPEKKKQFEKELRKLLISQMNGYLQADEGQEESYGVIEKFRQYKSDISEKFKKLIGVRENIADEAGQNFIRKSTNYVNAVRNTCANVLPEVASRCFSRNFENISKAYSGMDKVSGQYGKFGEVIDSVYSVFGKKMEENVHNDRGMPFWMATLFGDSEEKGVYNVPLFLLPLVEEPFQLYSKPAAAANA